MAESKDDTAILLSDQPTVELIIRARAATRPRSTPSCSAAFPLKRWAHGRLPAAAVAIDTADLVQDAAINVIARLDTFEPRHVGAMQAYLRQSVINRIRDEMRRFGVVRSTSNFRMIVIRCSIARRAGDPRADVRALPRGDERTQAA